MGIIFTKLYDVLNSRKWLLYLLLVGLTTFMGWKASSLRFEESISTLFPNNKEASNIAKGMQTIQSLDRIVFHIEADNENLSDPMMEYATRFEAYLKENDTQNLIKSYTVQNDEEEFLEIYDRLTSSLPFFLNDEDYKEIEQKTKASYIKDKVETNYRTLLSPSGMALKNQIIQDPLGLSNSILKKIKNFKINDNFEMNDGFIFTKDKKNLLFFVTPNFTTSQTEKNRQLLHLFNETKENVQSDKGLSLNYFGGAVVAIDNADRIRKDIYLTLGFTLLGLFLLVFLHFKSIPSFLMVFIPVVFGVLFAFGCFAILKSSISLIALGAGSVVMGIAIDFAIHFYSHFKKNRDIKLTIKELATPLTLGGFTTVGAFVALQFIDSPVLQDFGLFAAFGLVGASLFILIFYPHLLKVNFKNNEGFKPIAKIASYPFHQNKILIIAIVLLFLASIPFINKVGFESDMMTLNYMTTGTKKVEQNLKSLSTEAHGNTFLIYNENTIEGALKKIYKDNIALEKLKENGKVLSYQSVTDFLIPLDVQKEKLNKWKSFWTEERMAFVKSNLISAGSKIGFKPETHNSFYASLNKDYPLLDNSSLVGSKLLEGMVFEKDGEVSIISTIKSNPQNKTDIYNLLQEQSQGIVLDKGEHFNSFAALISKNFNLIVGITSILVFVVLLFSYGRIEMALITYLPMVISWVIILGMMGVFGLKFNMVNIIISTFIFGLGDDYAIFIMDALKQNYKSGKQYLTSYKTSIFLSALTTVIGIGVLVFAKHPALRSIGLISVIGMFTVLIVSNTIQPALFHWLVTKRTEKGLPPFTAIGLLRSVFAFLYFAFGCFVLMTFGFILLKLIPLPKKWKVSLFHKIRSAFAKSMIYVNVHVKKEKIGLNKNTFDTPSIVITNHHSVIDSLLMQSLSPKLILMVNDWVWNNTFMGPIVRLGGFIPKESGYEENLLQIKGLVENGYSIGIFPEGSRSPTADLRRFHKGAFYLAEQLNLDIQPVIFHGTSYVQGKTDNFFLKKGRVTVLALDRIAVNDISFGEGYRERTKKYYINNCW